MSKDATKIPNMPTVQAFLEATTIRAGGSLGFAKLGPVLARGRLSEVDNSLAAWWAIPINRHDEKLRHTLVLLKSCAEWSSKHQTNKGETRAGAQRKIGVNNVVKQCRNWIAHLFSTAGKLKSIDSHYAAERQDYKNMKTLGQRVNPVSGTYINQTKQVFDAGSSDPKLQIVSAILSKPIDQITDQDFRAISNAVTGSDHSYSSTVKYMSSSERESFSITVRNGILCDAGGSPITSDLNYAMSKYGTIFGSSNGEMFDDASGLNHTTFLSGKDVICAGSIEATNYFNSKIESDFQNNRSALKPELMAMVKITSMSGHYKPTAQNLKNCLLSLEASGLNLENHAAYHDDHKGTVIFLRASEFVRRY